MYVCYRQCMWFGILQVECWKQSVNVWNKLYYKLGILYNVERELGNVQVSRALLNVVPKAML